MRLIDADKLQKLVDEKFYLDYTHQYFAELLEKFPTVDAIPKEQIEQILDDPDYDIPFDGDSLRLSAIAELLGVQTDGNS